LNIAGQAITLFYHITQRTRADMPQTFGVNAAVVDASEAYVRNFISQRSSEAGRLLFFPRVINIGLSAATTDQHKINLLVCWLHDSKSAQEQMHRQIR
jgi:hypothetical protein